MKVPMWKTLVAATLALACQQAGAEPAPPAWGEARSFADAGDAAVVAPLGDAMNPFERGEGWRRGFMHGPATAFRPVERERDVITTALNGMWSGNGREWRVYPPPPHVPEAETWAMLGIGLLLLGALARRRRWPGAPRTASI